MLSSFVRIEKTILLEHFEKERSWEKKSRVPDLRHLGFVHMSNLEKVLLWNYHERLIME